MSLVFFYRYHCLCALLLLPLCSATQTEVSALVHLCVSVTHTHNRAGGVKTAQEMLEEEEEPSSNS